MITEQEIEEIGRLGKPHGIHGEINAYLDEDVDTDAMMRFVTDIDGIYVPFYIDGVRYKGADTVILSIDGIDKDTEAAMLVNHTVYALKADGLTGRHGDDDEEGGLYAADLPGFTLQMPDGTVLGVVESVDTQTENTLLCVERPDGGELLVPLAMEMIAGVDPEARLLTMDIPEGLLDL